MTDKVPRDFFIDREGRVILDSKRIIGRVDSHGIQKKLRQRERELANLWLVISGMIMERNLERAASVTAHRGSHTGWESRKRWDTAWSEEGKRRGHAILWSRPTNETNNAELHQGLVEAGFDVEPTPALSLATLAWQVMIAVDSVEEAARALDFIQELEIL